jgi:ABC-type nickel/cobalt efflux system permease component RcnA
MDLQTLIIIGGALALGATHAFEVDHMTAVTAFVATKPTPRQALRFGIEWAVGHGASLLVLGSILYALKMSFSPSVASGMERAVGVALFALGVWTLFQMRSTSLGHTHSHSHTHDSDTNAQHANAQHLEAPEAGHSHTSSRLHTHADSVTHAHPHRNSLWMGVLHGAAGTAAFVGESLVAVSQSYLKVVAFTLSFSMGVLLAMAVYGLTLGSILSYGERRSLLLIQGVRVLTGVWACGVGIYWVFR